MGVLAGALRNRERAQRIRLLRVDEGAGGRLQVAVGVEQACDALDLARGDIADRAAAVAFALVRRRSDAADSG